MFGKILFNLFIQTENPVVINKIPKYIKNGLPIRIKEISLEDTYDSLVWEYENNFKVSNLIGLLFNNKLHNKIYDNLEDFLQQSHDTLYSIILNCTI